ncbi:Uncharacterized protein dnm_060020 [Desulfonema magnum]|uniref:Uncharacterized protein n=1 Tax=Desulfonema magnum TaxID=45655 RepID=A0A975BR96_9BACT|nr:Uncharacterized protein dnm_060020 [Desulfonema magnum]
MISAYIISPELAKISFFSFFVRYNPLLYKDINPIYPFLNFTPMEAKPTEIQKTVGSASFRPPYKNCNRTGRNFSYFVVKKLLFYKSS